MDWKSFLSSLFPAHAHALLSLYRVVRSFTANKFLSPRQIYNIRELRDGMALFQEREEDPLE